MIQRIPGGSHRCNHPYVGVAVVCYFSCRTFFICDDQFIPYIVTLIVMKINCFRRSVFHTFNNRVLFQKILYKKVLGFIFVQQITLQSHISSYLVTFVCKHLPPKVILFQNNFFVLNFKTLDFPKTKVFVKNNLINLDLLLNQ